MKTLDQTFEHARQRALERYGIDLERREWERLNRRIETARGACIAGFVLEQDDIRNDQSVWQVDDFLAETVLVTFCHRRRAVTTFLPRRAA